MSMDALKGVDLLRTLLQLGTFGNDPETVRHVLAVCEYVERSVSVAEPKDAEMVYRELGGEG